MLIINENTSNRTTGFGWFIKRFVSVKDIGGCDRSPEYYKTSAPIH